MLEALFYYGLRLFSYQNYVGSLLHAYNVLRQFTELPPIPLLDTLSSSFADIVFPGGRPSRIFKVCYMRSMGSRLRFNSHVSLHKAGCHSMVIPSHIAKATAGFGLRKHSNDHRFDYRKISLFHHIKERGYHLDTATWKRVYSLNNSSDRKSVSQRKASNAPSCSHSRQPSDANNSCPNTHWLQTLRTAILTDFTGPFPIPQLNFLEVYLACVRTISLISDRYHSDTSRRGQNCLCFVNALCAAADRCMDGGGHQVEGLGCRELVEVCREVIRMEGGLRGRELKEFLWTSI